MAVASTHGSSAHRSSTRSTSTRWPTLFTMASTAAGAVDGMQIPPPAWTSLSSPNTATWSSRPTCQEARATARTS
ncbi:hypothetical protein BDW74DRAFT_163646 [Aspergillus multicolor]|uniref:uncharacterized protein n=1 Tax=Aspergillus multicolor TaxID=41759 RepID=UPI003CCD3FD0